jgi:hypothetical protein
VYFLSKNRALFSILWIAAASSVVADERVGVAKERISEAEASDLARSSMDGSGYSADRIWAELVTGPMTQCARDFYCFRIVVDAGAWSPVVGDVAVDRLDATVWDLWECSTVETPKLHRKQEALRERRHLVPSAHEPNEFFSDCSDEAP